MNEQWEYTITVKYGSWMKDGNSFRGYRADIGNAEPNVYGYGISLVGAVDDLMEALMDLLAPDER